MLGTRVVAGEHVDDVLQALLDLFDEIVESLYREIRALRIYEGATEVQKLIVARELIKSPPS